MFMLTDVCYLFSPHRLGSGPTGCYPEHAFVRMVREGTHFTHSDVSRNNSFSWKKKIF